MGVSIWDIVLAPVAIPAWLAMAGLRFWLKWDLDQELKSYWVEDL
jgi:hypothetical protein